MIVRHVGSSLLLITQPDHAALAGQIMRHWGGNGLDSPRREDILLAVDEHDNGWREVDSAPVVDEATGRILDFMTAPDALRRSVWPRGVQRLANRPYAAALVAEHAIHVYRRHRRVPEWQPFFAELETARDRLLQRVTTVTLRELINDYLFVQIGDLVSLTFCNGWTEPQSDVSGYIVHLNGTHVTVTPDPFAGAKITITINARHLSNERFASALQAGQEFSAAPVVRLTGTLSGP